MRKGKPKGMLGQKHSLAATKTKKQLGINLTPTAVNGGILAGGVLMGLIAWPYKDSPIGGILVGAGANIAAIALVFFLKEALAPAATPWYEV